MYPRLVAARTIYLHVNMLFDNVLEVIGNTPLVRINRLIDPGPVLVYAKLEARNPGGSIKERISLSMIEAGEQSGLRTRSCSRRQAGIPELA